MEDETPHQKLSPQEARDLIAGSFQSQPTSDSHSPEATEIPGIEIIDLIGKGGMGEVYLATETGSGDRVAVKVLSLVSSNDPLGTERFLREGEVLDRLNHPNLLKIRQRGTLENGLHFLVVDYASGGTVQSLLTAKQSLDEGRIIELMRDLCAGLGEVHRAGLIHRDIKPSNLLLDEEGNLILADFGLARELHQDYTELTLSGTTLGTASYMAPEQGVPGTKIDARADIFSAGVVLYRLLTGELPKGQFPPPSQFGRSKSWDTIISRCLATSPDGRFRNADELGQSLKTVSRPSRRKLLYSAVGVGVIAGGAALPILNQVRGQANWRDLLSGLPVSPPWYRTNSGAVRCPAPPAEGWAIFSSIDPGESYELKFSWKRISGAASLALFFPVRGGNATFEMGAWKEDLSGVQAVSGQTLRDPGGGAMRIGFSSEVTYRVHLKVSRQSVTFQIDDHDAITIPVAGREFQRIPTWTSDFPDKIGFGTWESEAEFSQLEIRTLD